MCAELLQAPETLVFFHENLNWQHCDRQSIFFNKNSCNRSFYVIFSSKLNNYKKIMYQCMSIYIVTLLSIFIHQRSAADRRPALHCTAKRRRNIADFTAGRNTRFTLINSNKYSLKY